MEWILLKVLSRRPQQRSNSQLSSAIIQQIYKKKENINKLMNCFLLPFK